MIIDDNGLLSRSPFLQPPLRCWSLSELKIGRFDARHEGQMKLYLKWLNRYERAEGEETPIGPDLVHGGQPRTGRAAGDAQGRDRGRGVLDSPPPKTSWKNGSRRPAGCT